MRLSLTDGVLAGDEFIGLLYVVGGAEVEVDLKEEEGVDHPVERIEDLLELLRSDAKYAAPV